MVKYPVLDLLRSLKVRYVSRRAKDTIDRIKMNTKKVIFLSYKIVVWISAKDIGIVEK